MVLRLTRKLECLLSSDTPAGIAKSIGLGVIGFADSLNRLRPDILVLLGDRYEILSAAQAALVTRVPIAHIAGGDTTESGRRIHSSQHYEDGASSFCNPSSRGERVKQLGENPEHVFNVGSPGLDFIKRARLLSRIELEKALNFELGIKICW